jgi:hypothetical protein
MDVSHRLYAPIALKGGGGNKIIFESAKLSAHSFNTSAVHLVIPKFVAGFNTLSVCQTLERQW